MSFPAPKKSSRSSYFYETVCIVILLAVLTLVILGWAKSYPLIMNTPYQSTFPILSPAIFFAAGHGLCTTNLDEIPGLIDFVYRKTSTFDVAHIPADFDRRPMTNPLALDHLYLLYMVGWLWRFFGVNVQTVFYLTVVMRLICAVSVYTLFRLGLSRLTAFIAVLIIFTSPAFLDLNLSPRDIGKAPVILSAIAICAWLAFRQHSPLRMVLFSLLLGCSLGIGYGIRPDTIICLPVALVSTAFLARLASPTVGKWRILGTVVLLSSFFFLAQPILRASALEGNHRLSVHVVLVGMLKSIESNLLPTHQPYSLMPDALSGDSPGFAMTNVLAQRLGDNESMANPFSAEHELFVGNRNAYAFIDPYLFYNGQAYSRVGRTFFLRLIEYFPADFLLRAWRATRIVFDLNVNHLSVMPDESLLPDMGLKTLFTFQTLLSRHLSQWGLLYFLIALSGLAAYKLRLALVSSFFFLWFTGYPSLQYEYRHAFYLAFIPIMAVSFIIEYAVRTIPCLLKKKEALTLRKNLSTYSKRIGIIALCFLTLYLLPLLLLRSYQHVKIHDLAQRLESSEKEPVRVVLTHEKGRVFVSPIKELKGLSRADTMLSGESAWTYCSVEFDTYGKDIPLTIHYDTRPVLNDFTHHQIIDACMDNESGRVQFFFPLYETDTTYSMDMLPYLMRAYPALIEGLEEQHLPLAEQHWWRRGKFLGFSFSEEFLPAFRGFNEIRVDDSIALLPFLPVPENKSCLQTHKTGPWESAFLKWRKSHHALTFLSPENNVWKLKEKHLPKSVFNEYPSPLLQTDTVPSFFAAWEELLQSVPDLQETAARDCLNYAAILRSHGEESQALSLCEQANAWSVSNPLPAVRLGELYEASQASEKAVEAYKHALFLYPYLPEVADRIDSLVSETMGISALLPLWKEIVERHPGDLFSGMRLALHYEKRSLCSDALIVFKGLRKVHPENPDIVLSVVRCLVHEGEGDEALSLLKTVLDLNPTYTLLVTQHATSLAHVLSEKGQHKEAASFLEFKETIEELTWQELLALAENYRNAGEFRQSKDCLLKAQELAERENIPALSDIKSLSADLDNGL